MFSSGDLQETRAQGPGWDVGWVAFQTPFGWWALRGQDRDTQDGRYFTVLRDTSRAREGQGEMQP